MKQPSIDNNVASRVMQMWPGRAIIYKLFGIPVRSPLWFVVFVCGMFGLVVSSSLSTAAATITVTTQADWNAGTLEGVTTSAKEGEVELQDTGSWGAQSWKTPDKTLSIGAAFASDGTGIYVLRGLADVAFWRYNPTTDTWTTLANAPRGAYYGADLQYLDGSIYAFFGGYQKTFARYSIEHNTWQVLGDFPSFVYQGGSMTTDGTYIYGIPGNTSQEFYRYNIATDAWSPLTSAPNTLRSGADLTHIAGYIYTPRGVNTNTFYRYDITAGTWATMTNVPVTLNDDIDTTTDGENLFIARQQNTASFYRYNVASDTWTTLTNAPYNSQYAGVQYLSGDGYIYFFRGASDYRFWKYDIDANEFVGPTEAPATLSTGSNMLYYNGHMYVTRGANTTTFYRYTSSSNSWTTLTAAPASFNDDTDGVVAGGYLYFFRGGNVNTFYRYDPAGNSWTTLANAPATVRFGASLAYPGSGNYIYATRGNATNTFWRYNISGNSWETTVSDLPAGVLSSYGSKLISDGTSIFFTAGIGIKRMYVYSIADNSWTELAQLPFSPYYGTDIAYHDGKIIALAGWYKNDIYEYEIVSNVWRTLKPLAGYGPTDIGPWTGASIAYDQGSEAFYVTRGGARQEVLVYTPGSNEYEASGSWTSQALDMGYVASWSSLVASHVIPGDSSVTYQTRSSSDGVSWTSWQSVVGTTIASTPQRYLQVRATLYASSTLDQTPTLKDITLEYVGDTTPPSNPSTFTGSSQQVSGESLTSGSSYRHTHPFFTWLGAEDTHSAIEGYYVYFGDNATADPVNEGAFQAGSNYQTNAVLSTGTYYLRVATRDTAGNTSTPVTGFVYDYIGVSPPSAVSMTSSADFSGTASNVTIASNAFKLSPRSGGFWLEERLTLAPTAIQYGGKNVAYVESSNKLYVLAGANNTLFREYDIATDTWVTLANAPDTVRFGGGIVAGPTGYLYAIRGNATTDFWRYDIEANTWDTTVTNAPLTISYGGALVFDGTQYIYITRGNNTDTFWRYDTFSDEWNTLSAADFGAPSGNFSNAIQRSGDMTIDRENGLIYVTQGNLLKGFSVYNINTGNWTVLPDTPTLPYDGSALAYDATTQAVYYLAGYSTPYLFKYDVVSEEWTQLQSAPNTFLYGAGLHKVGDSLYAFRGGNTTNWYRYNISKNSWLIPTRGLFGREFEGSSSFVLGSGADIVKGDGDNFYITRGTYADDFIRWNQTTGQITRMAHTPVGAFTGSSLVYDPNQNVIYFSGGLYDTSFFAYDIATNSWSRENADPVPLATGAGSSMVYDGARYIYLNRGNSTNVFYRFDTQGTAGNKWSTMANVTATLGSGAKLVLRDGYIYTLRGLNAANNPFYRYSISGNSWSTLTNFPNTVNTDGFLVDGNDGYFYGARATNSSDFHRYSVSGDAWTQLGVAPAQISTGASAESNMVNKVFMLAGTGTDTYQDALYTYVLQTENSGFMTEGSYISQTHDLTSVYKWANLQVSHTAPANTGLSIATRTSSNGSTWAEWVDVSLKRQEGSIYTYKINSETARYLQVRFSVTSADGILSPVVEDYTISYYQDAVPPTNPQTEGLSAYSQQSGGQPLISNNWYNYSAPYFEWPVAEATYGASDTATGSGVSGYYVYFGTNATADPHVDGVLQVGNSYIPSFVTSSATNYLRIKTVDFAGNVSSTTWDAFSYKYDVDAPSAPTNLVAVPGGYSAIDSFSFSWAQVLEGEVPVAQYCYKTGASSGSFATDQCVTELSVDDIPSYKTGTNTFYVRARDEAGNYSPYAASSYFFADVSSAPAPPSNLIVSPSSNTTNSFSFEWGLPEVFLGSQANLSYHFSVNTLPTPQSTTTTSLRFINAGAYATISGENVFYIVAKDEAGNINYNNYAQVSFFANTVAPGIPLDIEIADVSVKNTASWRLALSWDEPTNVGSGVSTYAVYRSTDGVSFTKISTTSSESYVDTRLSQVTYYYKVQACDNTQNCGGFSSEVSMLPDGRYTEAANLVSGPTVSDITTRKAVVSWATARTSDSRIAYGTSSGNYFDEEVGSSEQVSNHQLALNNLSPGTTYYFVAKWRDEDGNTGQSEEQTFSTLPPPTTEEPTAKNVSLSSAIIEFITRNASSVKLYYGETSAFGGLKTIVTSTAESTHTIELTELKDATKYFYKINTVDVDGTEYEGEMHSFETLPRPEIADARVVQIQGTAKTTLLVRWTANTPITSVVTYYPTANPQLATDEVSLNLKAGNHQMILFNLEPQTAYSIVIRGKDLAGNEAVSEVQQIVTSSDTRPPQIFDLKVETEIIGAGDEATAQLIVSYKTDEPATSQVEYAEGTGTTYSQKTQESGAFADNHLVIISGLSPGKVYHLRAVSKDVAGNVAESVDKVVATPKATENALDLVIKNLTGAFSFLRN